MLKEINLFCLILVSAVSNLEAIQAIPFELVGNLVVISAKVDDKPGSYIIDTGVPTVILNEDYFQGKRSERVMHGINGEGAKVSTRHSRIEIGVNKWKGVYAEITSLLAIERALGRPIHGLIGCQLFRNSIVVFDYEKGEIQISSAKNSDSTNQFEQAPILPVSYRFKGHIPVIEASVGSTDLKLIVDTGSAMNILCKNDLDELDPKLILWDKQYLVGLGHKEVLADAGTVFDLEIGDIRCAPMKTLFSLDSYIHSLCPGRSVDGVLGYEYLSQVRMTINFRERIISFDDDSSRRLDLTGSQK